MNKLINNINVAMARKKADLVLKNASIINVYTKTIDFGDIAIDQDRIVGIGKYEGNQEIDCTGLYVAPGFIDAHVHIESAMVTPEIYSHLAIKHGVTTIIADPHEIANVLGVKGLKLMINNSRKAAIDILFMLPSCVPAVSFEDNGATLDAKKLTKLAKHTNVLGLGEVMDVNAVTNANEDMLKKINMITKIGKKIDGHCPKVNQKELNAYLCAGIKTDHEATDPNEALEKLKNGMYVMMREGSQAKDLPNLLPAVNKDNVHRFLFCTDDRHIEDLLEEGSIDNSIRIAINHGLDPLMAYTIASLNASMCYNLSDRGAIAGGMKADLVILSDIEKCEIKNVIKSGHLYEEKNLYSKVKTVNSIHLNIVNEDLFEIQVCGEYANVIKVIPGSLITKKAKRKVVGKKIISDEIVNKISVVERHKNTGKHFTGYIEGLGLKQGTIALTIAHDSHNVIVLGEDNKDMALAVNHLIEIHGGIVIVSNGEILESISLPIAGIMTDENPNEVFKKVKLLNQIARKLGINEGIDPFITLSFMALPVIPELKITARGLFDYDSFKFINLFE